MASDRFAFERSLWSRGAAPQLRRNAVLDVARVVETLEAQYPARLRRRRHAASQIRELILKNLEALEGQV